MNTYINIRAEIVSAMKAKNPDRLMALRGIDTLIKNIAITKGRKEPLEEDVIAGLSQAVKRGSDSAEQFKNAGREELAAVEIYQVSVAKEFLPTEPSKEELKAEVLAVIAELGEVTKKDFGKILGKLSGKASNKTISEVVKEVFAERGI